MKLRDYITTVLPRAVRYELARRGVARAPRPLTLTFSVTAACQSRCLTCNIGNVYLENPEVARANLSLAEIERVFRSMGRTYFFNISGGEPYMRNDIAEIVRLACEHLRPSLIHIPTNALAPRYIERATRQMLAHMDALLPPGVPLTVKPSVDGIGAEHDRVRGAPGNFAKLEQTIDRLLALRRENPRLHVDLGTVISNHNLDHLDAIEDWVHARGVESYRHEIAEQRAEFHNLGDPITPPPDVYRRLTERFAAKVRANIGGKAPLTRITEAVRLVYYGLAVEILEQRRQVSPCYGGLSNIHMNFDGEIWPCCVLGGEQALGRAREWGYNIPALLRSAQARRARKYIADGNCACPLANQWLSNVLLTPRHMLAALRTFIELEIAARRTSSPRAQAPAPAATPAAHAGSAASPRRVTALVVEKLGTIPERATEVEI